MSLGLLATPTVTICKAAKMVFNVAPGNFYLSQYLEYQEANGTSATVEALAGLAGGTDAAFITTVLTNLGLADDTGAQAFLESSIAASGRGGALEAAIDALDNVAADDAIYGAAKTSFDAAIVTSVSYSTNASNNSTDVTVLASAIAEGATATGSSFTLTTGTDVAGKTSATTSSIASNFRFTDGGNEVISADIGTLGANDVLLDGSSTDNDTMNITLNGNTGTFTSNRIETFTVDGAAGTPVLDMTNVSNTTTINVSGDTSVRIDALNTQTKQPMITSDSYTRDLVIDALQMSGTTALGTAETINLTIQGASYGSTAATRSQVSIEAATGAGTLETLNITSAGDTANEYLLDASTNVTFSTVNFLGSQDMTTRVAHADVTGLTLDASAATGSNTLRLDKAGNTTTATNANLFTGFDNILVVDSTTPAVSGDSASLSGLKSGQTITLGDDFNSTTFAFSSVSGSSDSVTIILDNETASTDTDVAAIDAQNIETVTIQSSGNVSTSTTAQNLIDDFTGDATTITVTGDTSIDLDLNVDAPSSGSRSVTVDASANTAFVAIEAATQANVSYSITGTDGADTLSLNNSGGTLVGGAGNDTLTGGTGNDTITSGEGTNSIFASTGTDTITLGSGANTITFGEGDVPGTAHVITTGDADAGATSVAAQDDFVVTVNGQSYKMDVVADADTGQDITGDFVTAFAADILADHGVTVTQTAASATTGLTFTGASSGATFTASSVYLDNAIPVSIPTAVSTVGVAAISTASTITGFKTGSTDDVISFDVSEVNAITGITDLSDGDGDVAGGDDVVLLEYTVGTAFSDTDAVADGQNVIKVAYSNTINAFSDLSTAIDANNITLDAALGDNDVIATVFYDADGGNAIVGYLRQDTGLAALDDNLEFVEIASIGMSTTDYSSLGAANFSFVA